MACQHLVQHVQASAAYLKSLPRSTQTSQLLENQCKVVKTFIAKIQGPVEALYVAKAVQEHWGDLLSAEQSASIVALLNDAACKTQLLEMQQAASNGQQHWEGSFWKDIPKTLYDGLGDKEISSTMRMAELFQYLANMGLRAASECTIRSMLALYFYVDGCPVGADATMLYTAFHHVKTSWKSFIQDWKQRQGAAAAANGHPAWPGPPPGVTCVRLDFVKFMAIYNQIPVRSTNAALSKAGMLQPRGSPRQCIERSRSLGALPCTGQLALTDFGAGVDSTVPRLDLPATAGGQKNELQITTFSANTAAAPAADAAALQLSRPLGAGEARKSLAEVTAQLQQVQKDKKQQQQAAAAAPMKKQKKKITKKKKKGSKGKSKKTKAAGIPRSPKSSRNRAILKSKKKVTKQRSGGDDCRTCSERDECCTCIECGGVDGLVLENGSCATVCVYCADKQNAADADSKPGPKPKAKAKGKAAAKSVAKKPAMANAESARKVQAPSHRLARNASREEKQAFHMAYGCSKCRWQPGCTNSCWSERNMSKPAREGEDVN